MISLGIGMLCLTIVLLLICVFASPAVQRVLGFMKSCSLCEAALDKSDVFCKFCGCRHKAATALTRHLEAIAKKATETKTEGERVQCVLRQAEAKAQEGKQ